MSNKEKQVYKWLVKRGSFLLFEESNRVHLELDKENNKSCLLTRDDTAEVISIMTSLAESIWTNPDYVKEPYPGKQYKIDNENDLIYWDLESGRLSIAINESEGAIEINYSGDSVLVVSVNYAVEIIQIMTHYYKQF